MDLQSIGRRVVKQEIKGLQALEHQIDRRFARAVELLDVSGKIICTGVGKSGHIARKLAATMTSLGSPAIFIHPTEASHGDLGLIQKNDAIFCLSRSGSAIECMPLLTYACKQDIDSVLLSEQDKSSLGHLATVTIKLPIIDEAWGHAPTTSTVMQLALGDSLAIALAERRGFKWSDFQLVHPGGALGDGSTSS